MYRITNTCKLERYEGTGGHVVAPGEFVDVDDITGVRLSRMPYEEGRMKRGRLKIEPAPKEAKKAAKPAGKLPKVAQSSGE